MGKHISEKSKLIREAMAANPGIANTNLAKLLNEAPHPEGVEFRPRDIAGQRQAMKPKDSARKRKPKRVLAMAGAPAAATPNAWDGTGYANESGPNGASPAPVNRVRGSMPDTSCGIAGVVDRLSDLARDCGGWGNLRDLADRLASVAGG